LESILIISELTQDEYPVKDLGEHSCRKVLRECDICGRVDWVFYGNLTKLRKKGNGKDRCSECSKIRASETCKEKYGDEFYNNRKKNKRTVKERYDVDNVSQLDWVKRKKEQTNEDNLGVKNPSFSEEVRNKRKETCLKNHGVEFPLQSSEIYSKTLTTVNKNYGVEVDNISQIEEVKKKKEETCMLHFGVSHPMKSEQFKLIGEKHPAWIKDRNEFLDFRAFKSNVYYASEVNFNEHRSEIDSSGLRERHHTPTYEIDHKYSIRQAWDDGIRDHTIVAHWKNLQILTKVENIRKGRRCDITLKELLSFSGMTKQDILNN